MISGGDVLIFLALIYSVFDSHCNYNQIKPDIL